MHRAAVVGKPIAHSLSPLLHQAAYDALGLTDWTYTRHQVDSQGLPEFVEGLGPEWRGLSLTMPCKEQALLLATAASPVALQTGAVNTLVRAGAGWNGDNTDVIGVARALADAGVGSDVSAKHAVVVGSGATARSALAALAGAGTAEVTFVVRSKVRESTLAQARDHGMTVHVATMQDAARACLCAPVLVSTVPAGAADALANALVALGESHSLRWPVWLDAVYAGWPTRLAAVGEAVGAVVVPGIEMLIHQAAEQVRLMTGYEAPIEQMQRAGRRALE